MTRVLRGLGLLGVGGLFLVAGFNKLGNSELFAVDIFQFDLVSWPMSVVIAITLPWIEIASAAALAIPQTRKIGLVAIAALLVGFSCILGITILRGMEISCGCLGSGDGDLQTALIRNLILLAITAVLIWTSPMRNQAVRADE